ncbi:MAG: hypothetical protein IPM17_06385 [Verrucomicrobia bacterium]|jgi:hypothetical protein|nr:hypothetical protein [Verrucomicrobiota bacterium]
MLSLLFRALLIGLLIAAAEVAQGILRMRWLNPRVGDRRARQWGVVTGSLLILVIAWLTVPWVGVASAAQAFTVGVVWLGMLLALDIGFGRWVFRVPWERILREFDPRRGGWLAGGMLVLLAAPWIVGRLRGLF